MASDIRPVAPHEHEVFDDTIPASADLSANQFLFHLIDSNGELALATAGALAFVLQNKPNAQGVGGTVRILGKTEFISGAALGAGALVATNAAGKGIAPLITNRILGINLTALAAADERGTMLIVYAGRQA